MLRFCGPPVPRIGPAVRRWDRLVPERTPDRYARPAFAFSIRPCDISSELPATTTPNGAAASIRRSFRPRRCSPFYAERFTTVEVNYTFYRMPTPPLLEGWAKGTPDGFTFTLKAPRRITHDSKLQRCEELTQVFCKTAADAWTQAWRPAVSAAADVQAQRRGPCELRRPSARGHARGVRVPSRFLARRVGLRLPAPEEPCALRGRQREDEHAGRDDRRLRLLPAARRGLSGPATSVRWASTISRPATDRGTPTSISSTRKKGRARCSLRRLVAPGGQG